MQMQWNEGARPERDRDDVADTMRRWSRTFGGSGPLRLLRRVGIGIVGSAVLGVGVIMLVTPGPAFVVIPMGLGILALEFEWAQRWLHRVKEYVRSAMPKHGSDERSDR
jgi:uncharacterized protein (TIGR02611 family)